MTRDVVHQHEEWMLDDSAQGGKYCRACGQSIPPRCPLCHEVVIPDNHDTRKMGGHGELAHRECLLRSVVGGIGHLEDHQRGMTRKAAARTGIRRSRLMSG
jgi:hypothetical protein